MVVQYKNICSFTLAFEKEFHKSVAVNKERRYFENILKIFCSFSL